MYLDTDLEETFDVCPSCERDTLDRWEDNYGAGEQCTDITCQWFSIDGEME